jgi:hypothetical protein
MDRTTQTEYSLQKQKKELLQDLVDCIERERDILADLSLPDLWKVMEEKNRIAEAIEELPLISDTGVIPSPKENILPLNLEIDRLKEEIKARTKENVNFIQGSLAFVDGLISLLTGDPEQVETYKPYGTDNNGHRGPIYRRKA